MSDQIEIGWCSKARGHWIADTNIGVRYIDPDERIVGALVSDGEKPCVACELDATPEGYDACLGSLPGVRNACCGHGFIEECYVQFEDNRPTIRGDEAMAWIEGRP